jgi:hypothetical protein
MSQGRIRYVAREYTRGPRTTAWGIYDRQRGSWPVVVGPLASLKVPQRFDTEADAQAWADIHLNAPGIAVPLPARRAATRKRAS